MMTRLRSDVEGANAVEFALVLPILVLLLFGTMYGGSLFNSQQTVTQAAREGARFAATLPITSFEDGLDDLGPWFAAIELRALNILDVDRPLTPGPVEVCVRFYPETGAPEDNGNCTAFPAGAADDKQGARVEVGATREATLELGITAIGPLTLSSAAVARYEPDDLGDD